jgi:hypothetical protein
MFNHFNGAPIPVNNPVKAEPKIASWVVIASVDPNILDNPLLRASPPEINYPTPGITLAATVAVS